jgi:hypothetical protein
MEEQGKFIVRRQMGRKLCLKSTRSMSEVQSNQGFMDEPAEDGECRKKG